jgi:hypothetical protein
VIVLARQSLVDLTTVLIALSAFGLTWLKWRVSEPFIIVAAALIGLAVRS